MDTMSMTDSMADMASTTASSIMASASAAMDHGSHGAMDHDMGAMMGGCQVSMLWNWNTIDACFISETWRIRSAGMFAGSCVGVVLLVVALEMLRRLRASYDRYLVREFRAGFGRGGSRRTAAAAATTAAEHGGKGKGGDVAATASSLDGPSPAASTHRGLSALGFLGTTKAETTNKFRPRIWQQIIRSFLHMVQFAVAYFIMLLAMYYNGYIIICILIGAFLGHFIFEFHITG